MDNHNTSEVSNKNKQTEGQTRIQEEHLCYAWEIREGSWEKNSVFLSLVNRSPALVTRWCLNLPGCLSCSVSTVCKFLAFSLRICTWNQHPRNVRWLKGGNGSGKLPVQSPKRGNSWMISVQDQRLKGIHRVKHVWTVMLWHWCKVPKFRVREVWIWIFHYLHWLYVTVVQADVFPPWQKGQWNQTH